MTRDDFGAREVFFLLALMALAVGISWLGTYMFLEIVRFIGTAIFWFAFFLTNGF